MNKSILYFLIGVGTGAVGTYIFLKERFNAAEKEFYDRKFEERDKKEEPEKPVEIPKSEEKPDIMEYAKKLSDLRYANRKEEEQQNDKPYIISRTEYDNSDYDKTALIYYADGILAYEVDDEIFENADEMVGDEFKDRFEENEVFVRNDEDNMYFEIFVDERTYEEVSGNRPHGMEE